VAGSARWVEARSAGNESEAAVQGLNATVGAGLELSPQWRLSGSASLGLLHSAELDNTTSGVNASLAWTPELVALGRWRYTPSATANAGYSSDSANGDRRLVGLAFSHSVTRDVQLDQVESLGFAVSQSAGALRESDRPSVSRALAHSVGVSWQGSGQPASQRLASLTLSDSRNWGTGRGSFQLVNLQFTQRSQVSRYASWSGSLTVQATRNESSDIDVFTGQRRETRQGWQTAATGSFSLTQQRVFGVPRLRHTLLASVATQQIESRAFGDVQAPAQRTSESLESRLDWNIGRLEARLAARVAKVEGAVVAGVVARVQRQF
jgi:hypothetical protein